MSKERRPFGRVSTAGQLRLSLASPVYTMIRLGQAGMALLVTGSVVFSVWCWMESRSLGDATAQYATSVARVQEMNRQFADQMTQDGLTMSQNQITEVHRKVEFANNLIDKQAFSWTKLLSNLEAALPPRVSISSVRHNFRDSTIRLQGSVMTLRDLDVMVDSLESHEAFERVKVSKHKFGELQERLPPGRTRAGDPKRKPRVRQIVTFQLTVGYRSAV